MNLQQLKGTQSFPPGPFTLQGDTVLDAFGNVVTEDMLVPGKMEAENVVKVYGHACVCDDVCVYGRRVKPQVNIYEGISTIKLWLRRTFPRLFKTPRRPSSPCHSATRRLFPFTPHFPSCDLEKALDGRY